MVIAHEGGWDETAFVLVPLAVFAVLLHLAKRRADAEKRAERDDDPPS